MIGKPSVALGICLSLIVALAAATYAFNDTPRTVSIGSTIENFELPDLNGKKHTLNSLKGKNGTVLIFMSIQCPVVKDYVSRIAKLAEDYKARDIQVIGIYPNYTEPVEDIKQSPQGSLSFPLLKDKGNKIADMLGADKTPEVYLLDNNNKLLYQGRIDNHRNESLVTTSDLREALDAALAGKTIERTQATAFGCTIKRVS